MTHFDWSAVLFLGFETEDDARAFATRVEEIAAEEEARRASKEAAETEAPDAS